MFTKVNKLITKWDHRDYSTFEAVVIWIRSHSFSKE